MWHCVVGEINLLALEHVRLTARHAFVHKHWHLFRWLVEAHDPVPARVVVGILVEATLLKLVPLHAFRPLHPLPSIAFPKVKIEERRVEVIEPFERELIPSLHERRHVSIRELCRRVVSVLRRARAQRAVRHYIEHLARLLRKVPALQLRRPGRSVNEVVCILTDVSRHIRRWHSLHGTGRRVQVGRQHPWVVVDQTKKAPW